MNNEEHDLMDKYLNALHELNHEKLRREGFERDLVMQKKMSDAFAKSTLDIGYEARDLGKESARLKVEVADLKSEADRFKAEVDNLREKLDQAEATIGAQLVELDDLRSKLRL
jgi:uncharacterized coiled-coil DUF342 family protein